MRLIRGSAVDVLTTLPDESVHCCVTSPPYYGLRDYGVEGQIGLEQNPDEYVEKLVAVFREVRRVLRSDGTCWVNLGDSYSSQGGPQAQQTKWQIEGASDGQNAGASRRIVSGLKPKDLIGIPWRVAFALQADGWWLRQDIIWHKPNPMPESVKDRCTKAHEYLFLLAKSEKYWWDADALKEPSIDPIGKHRGGSLIKAARREGFGDPLVQWHNHGGDETSLYSTGFRNKRSVWSLASCPTPEAHFATFPIELPELCILAGCPEGGTVLDPFAGAGTTGLAALKNGREFLGIELNAEYIEIARARARKYYPLLMEAAG